MPMRTSNYLASLLLGLSAILAAPRVARADTILTFGPVVCTGTSLLRGTPASPYTESGFQIASPIQTFSWCPSSPNFGAWALAVNGFGGTATLSAVDNSPFSISSIDLASIFAGAATPGPLTFTGHVVGGGVVTQTFNVAFGGAPPLFSTFTFSPAFSSLVSLDLAPNGHSDLTGTPYQFSNIRLNATSVAPEPATLLLVGSGLFGMGLVATRRRRRVLR